ncbi:MAG: flagellar protein export ATPase FliI [Proteobacteria bacterium]|nr:flagellar protein export ATPase FliI [Pseudomonadota bacterium]
MHNLLKKVDEVPDIKAFGTISSVLGLLAECAGIEHIVSIGTRCRIIARSGKEIVAEVVGMRENKVMLMPFTDLEGVGVGCKVIIDKSEANIFPHESWMGRVINAFAQPIDDKGALIQGDQAFPVKGNPPPAHQRHPVEGKIDLGVRAVNAFLTCCRGQRMGIFAGSGVGKSMLVSMLTRNSEAQVKVIGLIGERSREVHEFIHGYLGPEGMKQAVIVVATSNESALMRKQAAYMTMAVAEYFRDQGKEVLCLVDSITRFAMAQREIGLSAGEPPATKGYTPTVFVELPKLLERAGPGTDKGNITGLFSVLVEGDDHNEPISDAVRGILDGHIVLDRVIAERGRYPAINILRSVSRTMPGCNSKEENDLVNRARKLLAVYEDMAEMIRLGAYRRGTNQEVDQAIFYNDKLENFLRQQPGEKATLEQCYEQLKQILSVKPA